MKMTMMILALATPLLAMSPPTAVDMWRQVQSTLPPTQWSTYGQPQALALNQYAAGYSAPSYSAPQPLAAHLDNQASVNARGLRNAPAPGHAAYARQDNADLSRKVSQIKARAHTYLAKVDISALRAHAKAQSPLKNVDQMSDPVLRITCEHALDDALNAFLKIANGEPVAAIKGVQIRKMTPAMAARTIRDMYSNMMAHKGPQSGRAMHVTPGKPVELFAGATAVLGGEAIIGLLSNAWSLYNLIPKL